MSDWQAQTSSEERQRRGAAARYRPLAQLIPIHWTQGDVVANDIRQHYYRTGGPDSGKLALVLLHGIMAGGITWLRVARELESEYDVVMPDARGHGLCERLGPEGIAYPLLVEDVATLLDALEIERPLVVGHSMGGVTAALLASAYPEQVRAVVLEDAVWGDTSRLPQIGASQGYRAWLAGYTAYLRALKSQPHEERLLAALPYMPPGPVGLWPEEEYVPWVEAQAQIDLALAEAGPGLWSVMRPEQPLAEVAREIACPLLLLTGNPGRGGLSRPEVVAEVVAAAPKTQVVTFEEAGHLIHLDAFERYVSVVRGFRASR
ncbi:MAG TPA: alpha/beta hydrolase [Ktedonobacterales bacterium]